MQDSFKNRLSIALSYNNMKPIDLVNKTKISKALISGYLNGKYKAKQDKLTKIANALNVNEAWLMGYDVPIASPTSINLNKIPESNVFPTIDEPKRVPVIGKISAGLPILAVENIIDYAYAPSSEIKNGYSYFYLTVKGDSMNQKFPEGCIILVQQQDTLENDEIGVFLIEEDATVKKYMNEDGIVILYPMSNNPIHKPQTYNPKKIQIKILGKVVSYQGRV